MAVMMIVVWSLIAAGVIALVRALPVTTPSASSTGVSPGARSARPSTPSGEIC